MENETTIRPPAHTHNANAESEEISPYDSQTCLIHENHLILLLVHSTEKPFRKYNINLSQHRHFALMHTIATIQTVVTTISE